MTQTGRARRSIPPGEAVRLAAWCTLALAAASALGPIWLDAFRPGDGRINDFYQDWGSARNLLAGMAVYTPHAESLRAHLGLDANPNPSIAYNAHPPASILLALPLARLPYPDAVLAWNLAAAAAFLLALALIGRELDAGPRALPPAAALLILCHPVYGNIYQAQLTFWLVLLITGAWIFDRRGCAARAGLCVGAAAAIKLFPAYLGLVYLPRLRTRPILAAAAAFCGLAALAALVLGLDAWRDYLTVVLPDQTRFRSFGFNLSIAGIWAKLFDPVAETGRVIPLYSSPFAARGLTLVCDLGVTLVVAKSVYAARSERARDLAFGMVVTAMLLVSPVTWDFSLPLLLVPVALLLRETRGSRALRVPLVIVLAVAWIPQSLIMQWAGGGDGPYSPSFMLAAPSIKFYVIAAILAFLMLAARRPGPVSPRPPQPIGLSRCAPAARAETPP